MGRIAKSRIIVLKKLRAGERIPFASFSKRNRGTIRSMAKDGLVSVERQAGEIVSVSINGTGRSYLREYWPILLPPHLRPKT